MAVDLKEQKSQSPSSHRRPRVHILPLLAVCLAAILWKVVPWEGVWHLLGHPCKQQHEIVILGDSFSDDGRLYRDFNNGTYPPSQWYWQGHFSNGPIWTEYLQAALTGQERIVRSAAAFPVPSISSNRSRKCGGGHWWQALLPQPRPCYKVINLALGGSPACESNKDWGTGKQNTEGMVVPWLNKQVDDLYNITSNASTAGARPHKPSATAQRMVFLQTGGNDYLNQIENISAAHDWNLHLPSLPSEIAGCIKAGAERLLRAGENFIVIFTMPIFDKAVQAQAIGLNKAFSPLEKVNKHIRKAGTELQEAYPNATVKVFEVGKVMEAMLEQPGTYGLTNTKDPCITFHSKTGHAMADAPVVGHQLEGFAYWFDKLFGLNFEGVCDDPDQHMWWDKLHPTTTVHRHIAQDLAERLKEWGWHFT